MSCLSLRPPLSVVALAHVAEHLEQLGVLKDNLVGSGERLCREYHVCAGGMAASATESAASSGQWRSKPK